MESFSIDPWPIYIVVVTYIIHVLTNYLVRALVRALLLQQYHPCPALFLSFSLFAAIISAASVGRVRLALGPYQLSLRPSPLSLPGPFLTIFLYRSFQRR